MAHAISSEREYQRMTEESVTKLVLKLSLPTVLSQMITSIYNMADTFFVTRLGDSAVGAVSIVYALQSIIQAVGFGLAMGAGSLVSRKLGEKDNDGANKYASSAVFSAVFLAVALLLSCMIDLGGLLTLFGSTDTILPYAKEYAFIILLGAPVMCTSFVLNNILRSEGKATFAMIGLTTGGIVNLFLDPLFIFGANMGVAGAALATVLSQCVSFTILIAFYASGKSIVKLSPKHISRRLDDYAMVVKTGLPTVFRQGLGSFATTLLNVQVKLYGDAAIAAVGIANKVYMLLRSFVLGVGHGFQPVAGYNFGAKKHDRVKKAFWVATTVGTVISVTASLVLLFFAEPIIMLFRPETERTVEVALRMLGFISVALPFLGYSTYVNQLYQSLGFVKGATVLASMRQGIFFVPLILILPRVMGLDGVLLTQPISDLLTFVVSIPFNIYFLKKNLSCCEETPKERKKKPKRKVLYISFAVIVLLVVTLGVWLVNGSYPAKEKAQAALASGEGITVTETGALTVFAPENYERGFIFYPGGRVEHKAYAPLLRALAEDGWLCVLVEMPFDLAFFNANGADNARALYPDVESWVIGGHSLGGVMAASHAAMRAEHYDGLLLLASYTTEDLSDSTLDVVSIYGDNDGVLNFESYEKNKSNLPDDLTELVIAGGNHALFGDYGAQNGDGEATITAEEQIAFVVEHVPMTRHNGNT